MMNTMMNSNTMNIAVVNAAREAGIKENELFVVEVIGIENDLCEMVITTEWNRNTCYVDLTTGEVLGLMSIAKTMDELVRAA